jgi:hypothetical protein
MKSRYRNRSPFGRHLLVLIFLFVFIAGSFGLATVWLRQQIALTATETRAMERRLVDLERLDSKFTGEIALAMSPFFLEAQNQRFSLGLRQPQENQVVRVDSETQIRFAEFRWNQLVSVPEESRITFVSSDRN